MNNEKDDAVTPLRLNALLGSAYTKDTEKFLGFLVVTEATVPSDVIEFWQDGKIIGRIVGLMPNAESSGALKS